MSQFFKQYAPFFIAIVAVLGLVVAITATDNAAENAVVTLEDGYMPEQLTEVTAEVTAEETARLDLQRSDGELTAETTSSGVDVFRIVKAQELYGADELYTKTKSGEHTDFKMADLRLALLEDITSTCEHHFKSTAPQGIVESTHYALEGTPAPNVATAENPALKKGLPVAAGIHRTDLKVAVKNAQLNL
tara:strand:+ start:646 stop:1215 length:570 start_codon:yes stop_codon:yes gene_type:complete